MCELMGLSFDRAVSAEISIQSFGLRGEENADGWGLAWYPDRSLALVKEPVKWGMSGYTRFLESYKHLRSPIYLAHVRHRTTGGEPTHSDTHPFAREWEGREYCFAHNGTVAGYAAALPLGRFRPIGVTDSEHLFCWLLGRLADDGNRLESPVEWEELERLLRGANELGRLNCLLSDGQRLFAYRDRRQWKGLSYHDAPLVHSPMRHLEDATVQVHLESAASALGVVVATCPLDGERWQALGPGELLVVQSGRIVFGPASRRATKQAVPTASVGQPSAATPP
jgi:predicted glutamine amidotransferase